MTEDIKLVLNITKESMEKAIDHLEKTLLSIRAGKANPGMLSTVMVDYYGTLTPLQQIANINTPDPRTLSVQPWEKPLTVLVEKAIIESNLGFNPVNKGDLLIINIPPLTEERRKELVKQVKTEGEEAKISIRNARQEANKKIKGYGVSDDMKINAEDDIQTLTNDFIKKIDCIISIKEKEMLTV